MSKELVISATPHETRVAMWKMDSFVKFTSNGKKNLL